MQSSEQLREYTRDDMIKSLEMQIEFLKFQKKMLEEEKSNDN